jgi:hypothetical protein
MVRRREMRAPLIFIYGWRDGRRELNIKEEQQLAGHELTPATVGQGAVGGLVGELATGLVPGTSAPGVAGVVNTAFGFVW